MKSMMYFCVCLKDVRKLKDQRDLLEFELEEMSQLSVSLTKLYFICFELRLIFTMFARSFD